MKRLKFYSLVHRKSFFSSDYKIIKTKRGGHAAITNYKGSKVSRFV